ncbi:hypothetical protein RR48_00553 [Papilio machaon]|uniref:Uncharacterized protein n=1 Tax=Papilio machaon TaxID=76193 RepID=A0A0N1ID43_PAPMA|nr:hypothetical protein RR48_00553 [Papilio machaon]
MEGFEPRTCRLQIKCLTLEPPTLFSLSSRPSQQFNVVRRVYQQDVLNKDADYQVPDKPLSYRCKKAVKSCGFGECLLNSVPIARWLPRYSAGRDLVGDLVAGATTAVMHIPQGTSLVCDTLEE